LKREEEAASKVFGIVKGSRFNHCQNNPILPQAIRARAKDKHNPGMLDEKLIKEALINLVWILLK
jgi:hypothetical protein